MIQSIARQPELRGELQGIMWLGFALTEAVVFYGLIGGLLAFVLVECSSSNTCRLLARDHAAPEATLLLAKVFGRWLVRCGLRLDARDQNLGGITGRSTSDARPRSPRNGNRRRR